MNENFCPRRRSPKTIDLSLRDCREKPSSESNRDHTGVAFQMPRAPFQVLVLLYRRGAGNSLEFAVLCRADDGCWQGVASGGEGNSTPLEAAKREAVEEAGIPAEAEYIELESVCSVPVYLFRDAAVRENARYVIPEYSFGADCTGLKARALPRAHVAAVAAIPRGPRTTDIRQQPDRPVGTAPEDHGPRSDGRLDLTIKK